MPAALTSDVLNFLVFRYLAESGFTHSGFVFGHEAGLNKSPIDGNMVPPGALVTYIQKGLQYFEMEANLSDSDMDDDDFSFLQPLDIITKDVNELMQLIRERKKNQQKSTEEELVKEHDRILGTSTDGPIRIRLKKREKDTDRVETDKQRKRQRGDHVGIEYVTNQEEKANAKHEESGNTGGPEPMDIFTTTTSQDVTNLEGPTSEVYACAWSPAGSLFASGSGGCTARIWTIADGKDGSSVQNGASYFLELEHAKSKTNEKSQDVTTSDWNRDGTLLATGSHDGKARIWSTYGERRTTLSKHREPILSIKLNKKGDCLLTGSCDKTAIGWDMKTYECKQHFSFHPGPILDVDWRNHNSFATSLSDHMIYVCKIEIQPFKKKSGHQEELNCDRCDGAGSLVASCSDDTIPKMSDIVPVVLKTAVAAVPVVMQIVRNAASLRTAKNEILPRVNELYLRLKELEVVIRESPELRLIPLRERHAVGEMYDPIRSLELLLKTLLKYKLPEFEYKLCKSTREICTFDASFIQHCVREFGHRVDEILSSCLGMNEDILSSALLLSRETERMKQSMRDFIEMVEIQKIRINEEHNKLFPMNLITKWNALVNWLYS